MSAEIAEFLRARYAEQRQAEMDKRRTRDDAPPHTIIWSQGESYALLGEGDSPRRPRLTIEEFHERYTDPAPDLFVLADLDAKEQILRELPGLEWHEPCASLAELVTALLAAPFAAHPNYKETWRP